MVEKILLFTPVYDSFFPAIRNSFHEVVHCELDYKDCYYTINWENFEAQLRDGDVKGVIFCNPHNPIGRVWTEEEVRRVCELCAKYDVYLFSDEVHCDFHRYHDYTPAGKFECIWKKLIVYTAISKSFNLAGYIMAAILNFADIQAAWKMILVYFAVVIIYAFLREKHVKTVSGKSESMQNSIRQIRKYEKLCLVNKGSGIIKLSEFHRNIIINGGFL